jgi:hypothetical protein
LSTWGIQDAFHEELKTIRIASLLRVGLVFVGFAVCLEPEDLLVTARSREEEIGTSNPWTYAAGLKAIIVRELLSFSFPIPDGQIGIELGTGSWPFADVDTTVPANASAIATRANKRNCLRRLNEVSGEDASIPPPCGDRPYFEPNGVSYTNSIKSGLNSAN